MEGIFAVPEAAAGDEIFGLNEDPLIEWLQSVAGCGGGDRIEGMQVAECVAEGVTDLPVGFGQPGQDGGRDADVFNEIHRGGPEADEFGAVFFDDLFGGDAVTDG